MGQGQDRHAYALTVTNIQDQELGRIVLDEEWGFHVAVCASCVNVHTVRGTIAQAIQWVTEHEHVALRWDRAAELVKRLDATTLTGDEFAQNLASLVVAEDQTDNVRPFRQPIQ